MGVEPHANAATWAFCGAPCGAAKCVRGVPKWARWGRKRGGQNQEEEGSEEEEEGKEEEGEEQRELVVRLPS